jgi:murein DD-endopeptidase MepM/ murein hydrolase activator NlpD
VTRQSAPALLERPRGGLPSVAPLPGRVRTPTPRAAGDAVPTDTPDALPAEVAAEEAVEAATRRTVRRPPGRRGPLWLAALVAGALLAAVPAFAGGVPTPTSVSAADYGLGAADLGLTGDVEDAEARRGISEAEAQQRLAELAASRAAREPQTVLPAQGRMTTCFCMRWGSMHYGIDLAGPLGTPIHSATDGVVLRAGPASGYGNAVYIQDADGNVEIYGHMKYYSVAAGDVVSAGDQIAKVGNQGQSTGPHLHFEIHTGGMNGKPTDPADWLAERGLSVG